MPIHTGPMKSQPESEPIVTVEQTARPGRPRSLSADQAIIDAAAALLREVGYRAMCMEAVAARAGVSKATLYRRHNDKAALVTATILAISGTPPREMPAPVGPVRTSMTVMLKTAARAIANPSWLPILGAMFAEDPRDGGLSATMRAQILDPSAELVSNLVTTGAARGELRPTLSAEVANDVLFGSLLARSMLGEEITDAWIDAVIASVWDGFGAEPEHGAESADESAATGHASTC